MVEQLAVNQRVVSSSLTLPASKNYSCKWTVSIVGLMQGTLNPKTLDSNSRQSTNAVFV